MTETEKEILARAVGEIMQAASRNYELYKAIRRAIVPVLKLIGVFD